MTPLRFTRRASASALLAVLVWGASACRSRSMNSEIERVEFGVLYGGDIQDRTTIPLELDATRQELALRVTFRAPLERERIVQWELERPASQRGADGGALFAAELGELRAHPGERRAEAKLAFRRGDLPGAWRLFVRLDGRVVLERSLTVSAPAERR